MGRGCQRCAAHCAAWPRGCSPCHCPRCGCACWATFLALTPQGDTSAIDRIAAACVTELQPLAAPLDEPELQRRRKAGLSASEDAMLLAWGYPYVLARYRFHLTLTGPLRELPAPLRADLQAAAERVFHGLPDTGLDSLSLFAEHAPVQTLCCWSSSPGRSMPGLIYVVGPSGAGKDSVLAWLRQHLPPSRACTSRSAASTGPQ